jgi:hypothetical protein
MPVTVRQNLAEPALTSRPCVSSLQHFEIRLIFLDLSLSFPKGLGIGDDVRICFLNPFDLMNLYDDHIREGSFIRDSNK